MTYSITIRDFSTAMKAERVRQGIPMSEAKAYMESTIEFYTLRHGPVVGTVFGARYSAVYADGTFVAMTVD